MTEFGVVGHEQKNSELLFSYFFFFFCTIIRTRVNLFPVGNSSQKPLRSNCLNKCAAVAENKACLKILGTSVTSETFFKYVALLKNLRNAGTKY